MYVHVHVCVHVCVSARKRLIFLVSFRLKTSCTIECSHCVNLQNQYISSLSRTPSSPLSPPLDPPPLPPLYPFEFTLDACAGAVAAARPIVFCGGSVAVPVADLAPGLLEREGGGEERDIKGERRKG